jgi:DNA repair ATPase RecN
VISYERELKKLHLQNAERYPDNPDDFLKWEEDETTDAENPLDKALVKIETLRDEIAATANELAQRKDIHKISHMIDKLSDITEKIGDMLNDVTNESRETSNSLNVIFGGISDVKLLIKLAWWVAIAFSIFSVVEFFIV